MAQGAEGPEVQCWVVPLTPRSDVLPLTLNSCCPALGGGQEAFLLEPRVPPYSSSDPWQDPEDLVGRWLCGAWWAVPVHPAGMRLPCP